MKEEIAERVAKVRGLMEGIQRMLEKDRPWNEVAQQIRAAYGALRRAELRIIQADIEGLVARKGGSNEVEELVDRIFKFAK
jgi:DNA-binding FrmR family transcriptional regulator